MPDTSLIETLGLPLRDASDKTLLILGSAPDPTIPDFSPDRVLICVNNSGRTAHKAGLGIPSLTIRAQRKSWTEIIGLRSETVLWITRRGILRQRIARPISFLHRARSWRSISEPRRNRIVEETFGIAASGEGSSHPSNGIFALAIALSLRPRMIILSGISLRRGGHSYNDLEEPRRQIDPDREALGKVAVDHPNVFTAERDLAEDTGLPLVEGICFATSKRPGSRSP